MSITLDRPTSTWATRPGWGIAVDLTPGEVVQARHVKVHKRLIGLALLVLLALVVGVVLVVQDAKSTAQGSYDNAQLRTTQLTAETQQFTVLTTMQRVIDQTTAQTATLMGQDVDFVNLMARIRAALPPELELGTATVIMSPPVQAPVAAEGTTPTPVPVPTGPQIIGSVTLSGTGGKIRQVSPFVSVLNHLRGVVDVIPTSIGKTDDGIQFTLTLNITDELYTHRYDTAPSADQAGVQ
jgi:hypothetical protein